MPRKPSNKAFFEAAVKAQPKLDAFRNAATTGTDVEFSPPDVAILVALLEEFNAIRPLLQYIPRGVHVEGLAYTNLLTELPSEDESDPCRCLFSILGDMGEIEAALVTHDLLRDAKYKPGLIVNIGISGATDSDVQLGDVVVSQSVHRYLADSKTVDRSKPSVDGLSPADLYLESNAKEVSSKENDAVNDGVQFVLAPRAYDNQLNVAMFAGNFAVRDAAAFKAWQDDGRKDLSDIIKRLDDADRPLEKGYSELLKRLQQERHLCAEPQIHRGPIGSGPGVGGSGELLKLIRQHNRKFLAIDMETGGVMAALRRSLGPPPELIIRGISDFADERKKLLDMGTGGHVRALAMRNAFRLFQHLLRDGLYRLVNETYSARVTEPARLAGA